MKNKLKNYLIVSVVLIFSGISGFLSCNSDTGADRTASVLIDTGIRNGNKNAKDAAPANVTAIGLSVSAADMNTINATIPISTGSLEVEVPVGTRRTFTVTASTESFSFIGSATSDIVIDSVNDITIIPVKQAATLNITIPNKINYTGTVQSFNLTVDYPGTSISISDTITPSAIDTTTLEVPTGIGANITLTTTPQSQSAVVTFSTETATSDFTLGNTADITLSPYVSETKIVIPDYNNSKIFQMNDMTGSGFVEATASTLNLSSLTPSLTFLRPYDIDFDPMGRIYIANYYGGSGMGHNCVLRTNDLNGAGIMNFTEASYDNGVVALAVDKNNNYIYYATNSLITTEKLIRSNYDNSVSTSLVVSNGVEPITLIRGIVVDNTGMLYIAGETTGSAPRIFKYNPTTENVDETYSTNLNTPWDVIIKSTSLYVANNINGNGAGSVIQLDITGTMVQTGNLTQDPATSIPFNAPHRFIAILNSRFYLIDEDEGTPGDTERITAFDNFSGNWEFFDPSMISLPAFQFYSLC